MTDASVDSAYIDTLTEEAERLRLTIANAQVREANLKALLTELMQETGVPTTGARDMMGEIEDVCALCQVTSPERLDQHAPDCLISRIGAAIGAA
jgi:hypothetical protein